MSRGHTLVFKEKVAFLAEKKAPAGMSRGQSQVLKIKTVHLRYLKAIIGDFWKLLTAIFENFIEFGLVSILALALASMGGWGDGISHLSPQRLR